MTRMPRTFAALLFAGSILFAQIPNPLNVPDPLGLSKKPGPAPTAPRSHREDRRVERRPRRDRHDQGKHKGQEKRENREHGERGERGERKGHGRH